jgi:FkbM family methyltransferase
MSLTTSIRSFLQSSLLPPLVNLPVTRGALYNGLLLLRRGAVVKVGDRELIQPILGEASLATIGVTPSWKTWAIKRLAPRDGRVFLDVGANSGETLFDVQLAHPGMRYVGFEPNPACAMYLEELVSANRFAECSIVPAGLAATDGVLPFYVRHDDALDACGTLMGALRPGRDLRVTYVPVFRLDGLRETLGLGSVGFVKIDVEGAELLVLQGMRDTLQRDRPVVLCEVLWTNEKADVEASKQRKAETMALLHAQGYRVLHVMKSPDLTRVTGVQEVTEFPFAIWTVENKDMCDYLFVPAESVAEVSARVVKAE